MERAMILNSKTPSEVAHYIVLKLYIQELERELREVEEGR